ncbi:MAG: hypothetical protein M1823_002108 [Watsoniomyces obsoletus]|nr:MAG: hypothetical protein M1823_002108 [Watsoniomyces obsoletus]
MSFEEERKVAELAVQRAMILTRKVFLDAAKGTLSKDDQSPVTVADFGAQALINHALLSAFPGDEIVGEEEASALRDNPSLRRQLWDLVRDTRLDDPESESVLGGPVESEEHMLEMIDAGRSKGGSKGRIWTVDPVDGTKGFLRGGQYAVALALIVDGEVQVGVLGCPNLPVDSTTPLPADLSSTTTDDKSLGVMFAAAKGQGAFSRPLARGDLADEQRISMKSVENLADATFCESVEAGHSSHGDQAAIAKRLGITKDSIRMDSQAKYGSIARGAGDIYLRLPVRKDYEEKIWDHAAGDLIVREADGEVTDANGNRLDFSRGRTLVANSGVVASSRNIHRQVLEAVKAVLTEKEASKA